MTLLPNDLVEIVVSDLDEVHAALESARSLVTLKTLESRVLAQNDSIRESALGNRLDKAIEVVRSYLDDPSDA